ncbi:MAG: hypothetical protein LBU27_06765 [Candidatus Peribacteria bacterium]|jgi:hypothetical protein|nr:hypothetical protein [Candidatus Peribacteria bacterium]
MQELLNRKKPRANRYDYTSAGVYFVTVCTQNHEEYFGKVVNEKMVLDEIGIFCDEELHLMLQKRPSVDMHEYIIMPNHIHLLLCVGETDNNNINICRDEACPLPNKTPTQHIPNKTPTQHISNKEPTQHILSEEAVSPTPIQPANITNQTL